MNEFPVIRYGETAHACGTLVAGITERGLCYAGFGNAEALGRYFPFSELIPDQAAAQPWLRRICAVLDGSEPAGTIPLHLHGTPFQLSVWQALLEIPYGQCVTYAQIARNIGSSRAARAVGAACGANRVAIVVPCHRVLASGGGLGGFAYGLAHKQRLLSWESAQKRQLLQAA